MDFDDTLYLYLENNSNQDVKHLNYFSDTILPTQDRTSFITKSLSAKDIAVGSFTWLETYNHSFPSDTMSFFILSCDTLAKYGWEQVRKDYNILVRYDLSLQDLQELDFRIAYPPDERMAKINMWHPDEDCVSKISNDAMTQTEKVETNDNLLLNEKEGTYLNNIFETTRKDFDFTNKKVGFLTGSSGKTMSSKEQYFDMHKKHLANADSPCDSGTLYIFDAVQKAESGGYDAAIVYWSKFLLPIEDVIKRLQRK